MDALTWGNMSIGFEKGRKENIAKRAEAARLFNDFKRANPTATFEDYQGFIEAVSGDAPWLRSSMPDEQQLQSYAATNAQNKAQADRMGRMEMMAKQAQLGGVFQQGMANNLLSTDGNVQQSLEKTIGEMSGGDSLIADDLRKQYGSVNYAPLWSQTQADVMDRRWDQIIQLGQTGQQLTANHLKSVLGYTPTAQQVETANLRVNQVLEEKRARQAQLGREQRNSDISLVLRLMEYSKGNVMGMLQKNDRKGAEAFLNANLGLAKNLDPTLVRQITSSSLDAMQVEADQENERTLLKASTDPATMNMVAMALTSGKSEEEIGGALQARGIYADKSQVSGLVSTARTLLEQKQRSAWDANKTAASGQALATFEEDQKNLDGLMAPGLNKDFEETDYKGVGNVADDYAPRDAQQAVEFTNAIKEELKRNDGQNMADVVATVAGKMGIAKDDDVRRELKGSSGVYEPVNGVAWSNNRREPIARKREAITTEIQQLSKLPVGKLPLARIGQLRNELDQLKQEMNSYKSESASRSNNFAQWDTSQTLEGEINRDGDKHPYIANVKDEQAMIIQASQAFDELAQKAQSLDGVRTGQVSVSDITSDVGEQMAIYKNSYKDKLEGLYRAGQEGRLSMDEAAKLGLILSGTRGLAVPNGQDYEGSAKRLRMLENAYINLINGGSTGVYYERGEYGATRNMAANQLRDVVSQLKKELANYQ